VIKCKNRVWVGCWVERKSIVVDEPKNAQILPKNAQIAQIAQKIKII
jgi:hypothetical protein